MLGATKSRLSEVRQNAPKQVLARRAGVVSRQANLELLSDSQRECLDASIKTNGRLSFKRLTDKSHDAAWKSVDENDLIEVRAIAKALPNAKQVLAYLEE